MEDNQTQVCVNIGGKLGELIIAAAVFKRINQPISSFVSKVQNGTTSEWYNLSVFQFFDNNQLSGLDAFMNQVGNEETHWIFPDEVVENNKTLSRKLGVLFDTKKVTPTKVKKGLFTKKPDTLNSISQYINNSMMHILNKIETERVQAIGCIECLWSMTKFKESASPESTFLELQLGNVDEYMKLDTAAMDAVNLLPKPDHPSVFGSLFGVLNRCKTKLGPRTLDR
jgi:DNA mismatch repair ATPase MutS